MSLSFPTESCGPGGCAVRLSSDSCDCVGSVACAHACVSDDIAEHVSVMCDGDGWSCSGLR